MSRGRWFVFFPVFLLAAGSLQAQQGSSLGACDRLLGAGYDSLPPTARLARMVQYANCERQLATNQVNRNYSTAVREVSVYETGWRQAVVGEIQGRAQTARLLLQNQRRTERAEINQRYEEESRAIQLATTIENRAEMRARAQQLLAQRRIDVGAMQTRHQTCSLDLESQIRNALLTAEDEIDKVIEPDLVSLGEQQREKLSHIGASFDNLVNAVPGQSIADQRANPLFGKITLIEGTARVIRSGQPRAAAVGMSLYRDDRVVTDARSRVSILFLDQSTLDLAEGANIAMDDLDFPSDYEEPNRFFSALQSLFIYTSGLIGKDPPAISDRDFNAPCMAVGIRG